MLLFIGSGVHALAQQLPNGMKNPKVGLVLSGGGAKGFAHVGVLKVLEASGVRVDFIGGTSMGAVVGALYASGYSASSIDSILRAIDFNSFLRDQLPRSQTAFFEKQFGEKHLLTFPVQKGKIDFPKALATGQCVYNRLSTLFSHVDNPFDFTHLPIPFYCVATELETGEVHFFEKGSLPASVRASASLPTLLEPIEIEGKAYIDGGVSNNFPIEKMQSKDVQYIIGVDVQQSLNSKEALTSALSILNQIINYPMQRSKDQNTQFADLMIRPKLEVFSVSSFSSVAQIIEAGEVAASQYKPLLDEIASRQVQESLKKEPEVSFKERKFKLSSFGMSPLKNYSKAYVLGKMKLQLGDSLTFSALDAKIGGLVSSNDFGLVRFRLKEKTPQKTHLQLLVKENETSAFIKLGLHYDPLYKSAFLINFTKKHLLQKNDLIALDLVFGDQPRAQLNYFVDNGFYTSYGVSSRFNKLKTAVNYTGVEVDEIPKTFTDFTTRMFVQTTYSKKFAVGTGLEHKHWKIATDALTTSAENQSTVFENSHYFNGLAYVKLDTYDRKDAPTSGALLDGVFKTYFSSTDHAQNFTPFSQLALRVSMAKSVFQKFIAHLSFEGGVTLGENSSEQFRYALGGYGENMINNHVPFFGYDYGDLENDAYLKTAWEFRWEFAQKHAFACISNFAMVGSDLSGASIPFESIKSGYALAYRYRSLVGPLALVRSWSPDTGNQQWYFSLGFWF